MISLLSDMSGSVGIAIVVSQLVRMTQVAHADIASDVTAKTITTLDSGLLERIG